MFMKGRNYMFFNLADISISPNDAEKLKKISHQTDIVTVVLLGVVAATILFLIVYFVVVHKKTKKGKRDSDRFKNYETARGTITKIEKVPYYVKPYENINELKSAVEKSSSDEVIYIKKELAEKENEKKKELEKFRYRVFYEFGIDGVNALYSGEFFVYEESEKIQVGKKVEVRYDPSKPLANFTAYSAPVGFFASIPDTPRT